MNPVTERDPAKNPFAWLMPRAMTDLVVLGRNPGFLTYEPDDARPSGLSATRFCLSGKVLRAAGRLPVLDAALNRMNGGRGTGGATAAAIVEIYAALAVDGAKLFAPTEEQFEAMEQVEIHIPIGQYRQPYPALAVKIPLGCRARLAAAAGLAVADAPFWVVVRHRRGIDPQDVVLIHLGTPRLGDIFYVFRENSQISTVEAAISRDAGDDGSLDRDVSDALHKFGHLATRAAMNLAIMLTRIPTRLEGPPPAKNYKERRAREVHGGHSFRIIPDQEIRVRTGEYRPPVAHGEAGGSVRPHWRKGHWRAHPGHGEARARGEQVPLTFIAPCLVRAALTAPGAAAGTATYRG